MEVLGQKVKGKKCLNTDSFFFALPLDFFGAEDYVGMVILFNGVFIRNIVC